jgi:hypothetical protein
MSATRPMLELTEEQRSESERIYERLRGAFDEELRSMAELMASKQDRELFGQTEYELRDRVHRLGTVPKQDPYFSDWENRA